MDPLVDALEALTGHRMRDPGLLTTAATHASWSNEHPGDEDYERLEFLGDAVVQLCASELLAEAYPHLRQDGLNNLRQAIVDKDALADVAKAQGLHRRVRFGRGQQREVAAKGFPAKLLCDLTEAVFGALLVDGGVEPCRRLARAWLGPAVAGLGQVSVASDVSNARNRLQEFTQARFRVDPDYVDLDVTGPDHARTHTVEVRVCGEPLATGTAPRRKDACKLAAELALEILLRRVAQGG